MSFFLCINITIYVHLSVRVYTLLLIWLTILPKELKIYTVINRTMRNPPVISILGIQYNLLNVLIGYI
jgi:hypothetical protein